MAKKKRKAKRHDKKKIIIRILINVGVTVCIAFCALLVITNEYDISQKKKELIAINEEVNSYEAENIELQKDLNSNDISSYIEKIAMEEFNYAYADEQRFYDTSRN